VVKPNLRGSSGRGKKFEQADNGPRRLDALKDLAAVNGWIRKQRWADAERIVAAGNGYGAYLAYLALGHQAELWRAAVGQRGISNVATFLQRTNGTEERMLSGEFGDRLKDAAFLRTISPMEALDKMRAPLFVYQGHHDPRTHRSEQDSLVIALRKIQHPVEYMMAEDEGLRLSQRATKLSFAGRSARFLEQALGLPNLPAGCKPLTARAVEPAAGGVEGGAPAEGGAAAGPAKAPGG